MTARLALAIADARRDLKQRSMAEVMKLMIFPSRAVGPHESLVKVN